jgi:hypothetical protein
LQNKLHTLKQGGLRRTIGIAVKKTSDVPPSKIFQVTRRPIDVSARSSRQIKQCACAAKVQVRKIKACFKSVVVVQIQRKVRFNFVCH